MQKIIPSLWFNKEAEEAAEFYCQIFPDTVIKDKVTLHDTPGGESTQMLVSIQGYDISVFNGGPVFKISPSISFMLNFDPSQGKNKEDLDALWAKLSEGGKVLMELKEYDFSKHYGWVEDKYGVSWQLILTDPDGEVRPFLMPSLLFTNEVYGKAEEAIDFYVSNFADSRKGMVAPYPAGMEPDEEGKLMFGEFMIGNQWFTAMDSAHEHNFSFTEGVSLIVNCDTQEELDEMTDKLSAVPEAEQCGWVKDKYGLSWQITPTELNDMLAHGNEAQKNAVTQAFLPMHRLDLAVLKDAFNKNA